MYSAVTLGISTLLYNWSLELLSCYTNTLYPLNIDTPSSTFDICFSTLFLWFGLFKKLCIWNPTIFILYWLPYFTQQKSSTLTPVVACDRIPFSKTVLCYSVCIHHVLSVPVLMNIGVVAIFWLSWVMLQWTWKYIIFLKTWF